MLERDICVSNLSGNLNDTLWWKGFSTHSSEVSEDLRSIR